MAPRVEEQRLNDCCGTIIGIGQHQGWCPLMAGRSSGPGAPVCEFCSVGYEFSPTGVYGHPLPLCEQRRVAGR
jgi:hypothetical protein